MVGVNEVHERAVGASKLRWVMNMWREFLELVNIYRNGEIERGVYAFWT